MEPKNLFLLFYKQETPLGFLVRRILKATSKVLYAASYGVVGFIKKSRDVK